VQVNTSKSSKTAVLAFTNPYWTADGVSRSFDIYRRTVDPTSTGGGSYVLATAGAGVRFGIPISETDSVSLGFSGENSKLTLFPGISPQRFFDYTKEFGTNNNTFKVQSGWARDTRDSIEYPTRGWLQSIGVESTLPVTSVKYYKFNYQAQYFLPLIGSLVYGANIEAGFGNGYGGSSLPFFQNYYGGGVGSVRGFDTNSLGPKEAVTTSVRNPDGTESFTTRYNGSAIGGRRKFTINNEILFPFPGTKNDKSVRGSVFFDAGQIYDKGAAEQKDNERFHFSGGVAIAWKSPIGALKFSYAIPFSRKPDDKLQRFQFQVGTLF
jgi:outer membrane protein insertion porin family